MPRINWYGFGLILVMLLVTKSSYTQITGDSEDFPNYPAEVKAYLKNLFNKEYQKYTFRPDYPGGFNTWQKDAEMALEDLIGLKRMTTQVGTFQTNVKLLEKQDRGSHFLQKGIIETEPQVSIPFWLLIPKSGGPFPLAVIPHGHDKWGHDTHAGVYHDEGHRQRTLDGDRDVAVQAVEYGFIAIAPAVRGLSEEAPGVPDIRARHGDKNCRSQLMHCLLSGRTAIAERVWDMMRIIDWALTLPEVDSNSVLMTGNSGGGMVTLYTAACDKRITIAVPSCSFTVFASDEGYIYHCDCNAIPGILQWGNLYDVAGLIAPRYLLTVNGRKDKLHSIADITKAATNVEAIYMAAGVPSHYQHRWGRQGHRYYKDLMWPFILESMDHE